MALGFGDFLVEWFSPFFDVSVTRDVYEVVCLGLVKKLCSFKVVKFKFGMVGMFWIDLLGMWTF